MLGFVVTFQTHINTVHRPSSNPQVKVMKNVKENVPVQMTKALECKPGDIVKCGSVSYTI